MKAFLEESSFGNAVSTISVSPAALIPAATQTLSRTPVNRLLSAQSAKVQNRLIPALKLISLPSGTVLLEPAKKINHVYFPNDAIISLYHATKCGSSAEGSLIGNDGMVGIAALMGGSRMSRAVVSIAGTAYQLPADILKSEFDRHDEFLTLTMRYLQSLITQTAQTAACNRHHSIDQQFCRWLLLMLDRLPDNEVRLTQEMIANMLGVRRESVTQAAGRLQKLDVIEYGRGRIVIKQRGVLESRSCECYAVVKRESDRLLPPT